MVEIHGSDGGTVTEVGDDGFWLGDAEFFRQLAGDVAVRGAVETVAADFVVGVELVWQRVEIGALRHMLVEGGVEDDDLFQLREDFARSVNTGNVRRVVQRGEADAVHNLVAHIVIHEDGFGEIFTAMHDAVADRLDFVHQPFFVQCGNDVAQRFLVRTGIQRFFEFVALGVLDGDVADAADTEAFSEAFQRLVAVLRIDDGKFQAGRAAVQDKNVVGHDDFL
ncbi:hypothetical protein HMPREF9080_00224 [Cardiobacterium valvarum F0432]|uniref:Uncharacterized protein n=1 Tax=Cardiobacterium valvarum F0432 TaxID=797473 RepID=G9ZBU7_9GAMM|nr:hypothetical protein HMPREF9080_00224 [Cardiobacterium valvarum F0432]